MILALLGAIVAAPAYWLLVPERWRRVAAMAASLAVLGIVDARLPVLAVATATGLWLASTRHPRGPAQVMGLLALAALFVWNKHAGGELSGPLATQGRLEMVGVSYLVLKAAAVLLDVRRGTLGAPAFGTLLAWIAFGPTYPAGPIERFEHFRTQSPRWDPVLVGRGLERIVFGAVKSLVFADQLAAWAGPVLAAPAHQERLTLLAALWAVGLRFYLDFAGYSDIAIGLGAVFGVVVEENFDRPFLRRNLALLWQHWHMTLTRWLREQLFVPISRMLLRHARWLGDRPALALAQVITMTFCGLWHGLAWHFALWGFLQAVGLVWVGLVARDVGRLLPTGLVEWWRRSSVAAAASTFFTVQYFVATLVFVVGDVHRGCALLVRLVMP